MRYIWIMGNLQSTPMKWSTQLCFEKLFPTNEWKQKKFIHMRISVISCVNFDIISVESMLPLIFGGFLWNSWVDFFIAPECTCRTYDEQCMESRLLVFSYASFIAVYLQKNSKLLCLTAIQFIKNCGMMNYFMIDYD